MSKLLWVEQMHVSDGDFWIRESPLIKVSRRKRDKINKTQEWKEIRLEGLNVKMWTSVSFQITCLKANNMSFFFLLPSGTSAFRNGSKKTHPQHRQHFSMGAPSCNVMKKVSLIRMPPRRDLKFLRTLISMLGSGIRAKPNKTRRVIYPILYTLVKPV